METPNSQPYIIKIENNSEEIIENLEIIDNFNSSNFNEEGNLVIGSVIISCGIPTISYREMLFMFKYQEAIEIVNTYLSSKNSIQKNEKKTIELDNSKYDLELLENSNIEFLKYNYKINNKTKLKISAILPKTTLNVLLYPKPINLSDII